MHLTPLQSLFEHSFYAVSDLAFLVLNAYAATIIYRAKWRVHFNWIIAFVVECLFVIIYRAIISAHYFFGVPISAALYSFGDNCLYTANILGIAGNFILCRTFKQLVETGRPESDPLSGSVRPEADETIWPPPPNKI